MLLSACQIITNRLPSSSSEESAKESSIFSESETTSESESISQSLPSEASSNQSSQSIPSESSSAQSSESSASQSSESASSEEPTISTAASVRVAASNLTGTENTAGIIVGEASFEIVGRVMAVVDLTATTKDYAASTRYKALVMDESGYITVSINDAFYAKVKDYAGQENTTYRIRGVISKYRGNPELLATEYTFLNTVSPIADIFETADSKESISQIKDDIAALRVNIKGSYSGELISFRGKYLAKLDDSVLLFTDGTNVIPLHGSSKIGNSFTVGNTYEVACLLGMNIYRPSLEFISNRSIELVVYDVFAKASGKTATAQYSISYTKDQEAHSTAYENEFYTLHSFNGFVNYYVKSGAQYVVIGDKYKSSAYDTYTSALNAKTIFVKNDEEQGIKTDADASSSNLYKYALENQEVELIYYPYMLNTNHYWMGFVFPSTIQAS